MKRLIAVLIALLVLPSVTLAAKGGNKPPEPDYEALIAEEAATREAADIVLQSNITAEETARQDGDAALQSQIDALQDLINDIYNSNKFGNILVYDANNQFLGILPSAGKADKPPTAISRYVAEIFIPSLNLATIIADDYPPVGTGTGHIAKADVYFTDSNCSVDPHLRVDLIWPNTIYRSHGGFYYTPASFVENDMLYSSWQSDIECYDKSGLNEKVSDVSVATEVLEADIPFSLPIALPLRYEY